MSDVAEPLSSAIDATREAHQDLAAELAKSFDDLASGRSTRGFLYCGLRGSGRTECLQWACVAGRAANLLTAQATIHSDLPPGRAVLDAMQQAAEELLARRPGAAEARKLDKRLRSAIERRSPEDHVLSDRDLTELSRLTNALGQAAEEAREGVVLVLGAVPPSEAGRDLLAALAAGTEALLPLLLLGSTLPISPSAIPEGWQPRHLQPLATQAATAIVGDDVEASVVTKLIELTGGWHGLLAVALEELTGSGAANTWTVALVEQLVPAALKARLASWAGGLSNAERRYLQTMADLGGADAAISTVDVGRALGDTTRFSTESSALAKIRTALLERAVIFSPAPDTVRFGLAGLEQLLR